MYHILKDLSSLGNQEAAKNGVEAGARVKREIEGSLKSSHRFEEQDV
jgi:hypothetical protein